MEESILYFCNEQYLAHDSTGKTTLVSHFSDIPIYKHCYFKVQHELESNITQKKLFTDNNFPIYKQELFSCHIQPDNQIVFKRLSEILNKTIRNELFPSESVPFQTDNLEQLPHFINEMALFSTFTFQRLFITQEISWRGRYEVIVNREGRFEVEEIDDFIPVRRKDGSPIWGMSLKEPWKLLIAKVLAKKTQGYHNIKFQKPFQFFQYFTPCLWRYVNLEKEGRYFLIDYFQKLGKSCRIFLKTKQDNELYRCGLNAGRLGYELVEMSEFEQMNKKEYNLCLRSSLPHQWAGNLSIYDPEFKHIFKKLKQDFQLDYNFLVNQPDFFNLFSSAYITTLKPNFPQFIDSSSFRVSPYSTQPFLFEFTVVTQGHFIITIKQGQLNKQKTGYNIKISLPEAKVVSQYSICDKYSDVKYLLARLKMQSDNESQQSCQSQIKTSTIFMKWQDYIQGQMQCQLRDYDFSKGYNKGDAHPIAITPGHYVLRVETEPVSQPTNFSIQYISHQPITLKTLNLNVYQDTSLVKSCLLSLSHKVNNKPIYSSQHGLLSFGDLYGTFGYSFICFQLWSQKSGILRVQVNPETLQKEGYRLCFDYKKRSERFYVNLQSGQHQLFILEQIEGLKKSQYVWPPQSIEYSYTKID